MKEENISNIELKIIDVREEEKEYIIITRDLNGLFATPGITDRGELESEAHSWV